MQIIIKCKINSSKTKQTYKRKFRVIKLFKFTNKTILKTLNK